jgi:HEAT repeat protein
VRSSAAQAIMYMSQSGNLGEPAKLTTPSLIPLLNDADAQVRWSAAEALGEMYKSAESAIPSLIPLLNDPDERVRRSTAEALEKLGYKP